MVHHPFHLGKLLHVRPAHPGEASAASKSIKILRLSGLLYLAAVLVVVAVGNIMAAQLEDEVGTEGLDAALSSFDQWISLISLFLAVYLGIWSAQVGLHTGRLLLGFGLLAAGVAVTALAFILLPLYYIPALGYTASTIWLFGNSSIYVGAWLLTSVAGLLRVL